MYKGLHFFLLLGLYFLESVLPKLVLPEAKYFLRGIGRGQRRNDHGFKQVLPLPIRAALLLLTYNYWSGIRLPERKEFYS